MQNLETWRCFRCGEFGHLKDRCPTRGQPAPAAPAADAAAAVTSWPPPVPDRRPDEEIADAAAWARKVRDLLGWSPDHQAERLRRLAREQVAESRSGRAPFEQAPRARPELSTNHAKEVTHVQDV